jgi:hypothetical protein
MIYKKNEIDNTILLQEIVNLVEHKFVPNSRKIIANKKLNSLNTNIKWWIRLLYVFLGLMTLGFAYSFFDITILDALNKSYPIVFFVQGIVTYLVLEFLVREKKYFNHGISDAFLLSSFAQVIFYVSYFFDYENILAILLISAVLSALLAYRFVNVLMALVLFCSLYGFHFAAMLELGTIGKMLLPFSSILFTVILLYLLKQIKSTRDYFFYYESCISILESLSFVVLYLSGNYLVVRMASEALMNVSIQEGKDISFAWFFNLFTLIVPVLYVYSGIKKKNKNLLYIGLAALVFAMYTIRTYHHVLPTEFALIIGGVVLFCIAYFSIKKLKNRTEGLTCEPDSFETDLGFNEIETFATATDFGIDVQKDSTDFGFAGGKFGGGGAGSSF